jgi:uncharacterized protein
VSNSIDQQFVEFVVKSLVSNPDAVSIERKIDEKGVLLELTVDQEDLGRVIGKRGATAQSIRTLLRALGTKNDARYNLKIVDVGPPPEKRRAEDGERGDERAKESDKQVTKGSDKSEEKDSSNKDNSSEDEDDDVLSRTRKELDDLDDLDI